MVQFLPVGWDVKLWDVLLGELIEKNWIACGMWGALMNYACTDLRFLEVSRFPEKLKYPL